MSSRGSPVGYLFSDIEGSTERWEKTPAQMQVAAARLDALIDEIVLRHGGVVQDRAGDGVFATFRTGNPLQCALDIQLEIQRNDWSAVGGLFVRVGVHGSRVSDRAAVNRASRIMSSGWGGQIVVSGDAKDLYAAPAGSELIDLGVGHFKGIEEPLVLSGLIHPDLQRTEFPPLRSLFVQGVSGPAVDGPIFGRERELNEVLVELSRRRLLTIIGPGGNGKTRLAAQAGAEHAIKRPVCFVSLESVSNNSELVSAIARALRLPLHGAVRPEDQLIDYLRERRTLLVLDNAESVAGDAAFIGELIAACAQLTILATSREPLRAPGETLFRLPGIALPSRDPSEVENSPALQLFLHEARLKDSTFVLSGSQVEAFHKICTLVDGSPLALRLTAQWTNLLSLEEILERLQRGLDFLSAGEPQQRGHTIRSVFEGSWKLLSADQRMGLARLSVFVKAFDWNGASRVAKIDLETFATLERKGLLEQTANRRFVMHPLVHEYACEKLLESPAEAKAAHDRHSAYYLDAVCVGLESMASRGQGAVLEELQRDFPEIRIAWFHAVEANAKARILKVIEPLCNFLYTRSMFREALEVFQASTGDEALQRYFASIYANFLVHQGDAKGAAAAASSVLAVPGGARGARAHAHHTLGNLAHMRGDFAQARSHYERALAIREKTGDLMGCCYADISLAALHLMFQRISDARRHVKRGYRLARQIGDTFGMMASHLYAGDIAAVEQRLDAAQSNYEKGLNLEESAPNTQFRSMLHRRLGSLFILRGDHEGALRHHREAHDLARDVGDQRTRAHSLVEIGNNLRLMSQFGPAKTSLLRGIRLSMALGMQPILTRGLLDLAQIELRLGNPQIAARLAGALNNADLGDLRPAYEALIAELGGGEPAAMSATTVQDLVNEIIAEAEVDSLKL